MYIFVNPFSARGWGQKTNCVVIFLASSEIRRCKLLILCQKLHCPRINRFDGAMVLTERTRVGMIRVNYNMTDEINFRAEPTRFTHKRMLKTRLKITC